MAIENFEPVRMAEDVQQFTRNQLRSSIVNGFHGVLWADSPETTYPRRRLVPSVPHHRSDVLRSLMGRYASLAICPRTGVVLHKGSGRISGRTFEVAHTVQFVAFAHRHICQISTCCRRKGCVPSILHHHTRAAPRAVTVAGPLQRAARSHIEMMTL